jgi:hypothetical protein
MAKINEKGNRFFHPVIAREHHSNLKVTIFVFEFSPIVAVFLAPLNW